MINEMRREEIRLAYREILMREADEQGVDAYIKSGLPITDIKRSLKSSAEYRNKIQPVIEKLHTAAGKNVLLFGAYGNNNLGDAIQPEFILSGLREAGFEGNVWATSFLEGHYHFPNDKKLPHWVITSHKLLEAFDLIIIGGGGLLSHPHYPLNNREWAEALRTKVALLSVGATNFAAFESELLIKKAMFVSARDEVSLKCLSQFRNDVEVARDPVLCMQDYGVKKNVENKKSKVAWVLKGPLNDDLYEIRGLVKDDDVVMAFEKKIDQDIECLFPEIVYTPTAISFWNQVKSCNSVFAMRYHGIILSLPYVSNIYSAGDQKNKSLLEDLRGGSYFSDVRKLSMIENKGACDKSVNAESVFYWREEFLLHLQSILNIAFGDKW
jgi:polysaccharide pyruvyl transferase WcaK-like protein